MKANLSRKSLDMIKDRVAKHLTQKKLNSSIKYTTSHNGIFYKVLVFNEDYKFAEELKNRFYNEAKILEKINGSGIIPEFLGSLYLSYGKIKALILLVEKAEGFKTLEDYLYSNKINKIEGKLKESLLNTLNKLHSFGISHNELHHGNILVKEEDGKFNILFVDFEKACKLDEDSKRMDKISILNSALFGELCY